MKIFVKIFVMLISGYIFYCYAEEPLHQNFPSFDTVLVVLGNEPLDDKTPTVDMMARVKKAVAFQKECPTTLLIFTGGPTAGTNSEAKMMADIAIAEGAITNLIHLEDKTRSTEDSARKTASFLEKMSPEKILIVSKKEHLEWAMHVFKKIDVFKRAEALPSEIKESEIIAQMEEYLKTHNSPRVRKRLQQIKEGTRGTD